MASYRGISGFNQFVFGGHRVSSDGLRSQPVLMLRSPRTGSNYMFILVYRIRRSSIL